MNDTWARFFARFVIGCLVAVPYLIIPTIIEKTSVENAYVLMVFKFLVPALLIGFSLFFVADWVNKRVGLLEVAFNKVALPKKDEEEGLMAEVDLDEETGIQMGE